MVTFFTNKSITMLGFTLWSVSVHDYCINDYRKPFLNYVGGLFMSRFAVTLSKYHKTNNNN